MIRSIIGALVGRQISQRGGRGGTSGAIGGMIATRVLSRMGPMGMVLGGGYLAKKAYDQHKASRRVPPAV